jgi:opacity protein-like surface antigen
MKRFDHWVFLSFLLLSLNLMGQDKWTLEFKPGLNFPSTDIGETSLQTGFGFELIGAYKISPQFDIYAGWGWNQFKTKKALISEESDVNETGYSFGLKFKNPFLNFVKTSYVLSAGGIYNHLEVEDRINETLGDTGHGLGWQASVGLEYLIAENWSLRPELRYRSLSEELTFINITEKIDHRYISFGLGLAVSF